MMVTQNLRILFLILVSSLWCFSCSGDDPQPGCFQDEGLVIEETLTNATGTIRGPDNTFCGTGFVIEPDVKVESGPLDSFFPCNMTEEFKVDGARIIFSGYIYEGINDGDQCADFFEITEIQFLEDR